MKVSRDVFQERLDRVLRLVPGVLGITDEIVIHGATENTHYMILVPVIVLYFVSHVNSSELHL